MEVSEVRRRLRSVIEEAKKRSAERKTRRDEAARAWEAALPTTAVPAFQLLASALTGEGLRFKVVTPGEAVRLVPERGGEEFIELSLDSAGQEPAVMLRSVQGRGRRMINSERAIPTPGGIVALTEDEIVAELLDEIVPFIER